MSTLSAKFLGFEHIKELYLNDLDFSVVFDACKAKQFENFTSRMINYFERTNFTFPNAHCINFLLQSCMRMFNGAFWNS